MYMYFQTSIDFKVSIDREPRELRLLIICGGGGGLNNLWGFTWFSGGKYGGTRCRYSENKWRGGGVRKVTVNEGRSTEYYRVLEGIKYIFLRHDRPKATNNRLADSFLLQIFIAVFLSWAWLAFCFCCFKSDIFHWAVAC